MRRIFAGALAALVLAVSCGDKFDTSGKEPSKRELLARFMPDQMADGQVKVAVIRNLTVTDHSRQFLEGAAAEGRSFGFIVDTFTTGGDNKRCGELIARIAGADYDGVILSYGDAGFTGAALKPVSDRGLKVVTFNALPAHHEGTPLPGVVSTAQNDEEMARSSLEALRSRFDGLRPVRVIRAWAGPGIPPLDRRQTVYDEFVRAGEIEELALVRPQDFADARGGIRKALTGILPEFPPGSVDGIWASYDEFAKGCVDALMEAGREDIKLVSLDISSDGVMLMREHSGIWVSTSAADPRLMGGVTMRILAAQFSGEPVPAAYNFDTQLVWASELNRSGAVPGWDQGEGPFGGYPWMAELKAAGNDGKK
ncbi:MAG: substrate-binding domain-containing protein [Treponema sp.]|jgi:simple sugar transport system substrate-binding protein|nr:substrate-binding domain-containing protein [Treponema sp.]